MRLIKKQAIIDYLVDKFYWDRWGRWISWNIKVYGFDASGKSQNDYYGVEDRFDEKWEQYLEDTPEVFDWACQDALSGLVGKASHRDWDFFEGHPDKDLDGIQYEMYTAGRCGGHLILDKFDGGRMDNVSEERLQEWDYRGLWILYKFCKELDAYVDKRDEVMADQYSFHRYCKEIDEWRPQAKEDDARLEMPVGPVGVMI